MNRTRDERGRFYLGRMVAQILIGHGFIYTPRPARTVAHVACFTRDILPHLRRSLRSEERQPFRISVLFKPTTTTFLRAFIDVDIFKKINHQLFYRRYFISV